MTKEYIIKKLDYYIEDEKKAHAQYIELVDEIRDLIGNCPTKDIYDSIMDLAEIADQEYMHLLKLARLRCLLS